MICLGLGLMLGFVIVSWVVGLFCWFLFDLLLLLF